MTRLCSTAGCPNVPRPTWAVCERCLPNILWGPMTRLCSTAGCPNVPRPTWAVCERCLPNILWGPVVERRRVERLSLRMLPALPRTGARA